MTAFSPIAFDAEAIRSHVEMIHDLAAAHDGIIPLCIYGEDPDSVGESGKTKVVQHFRVGNVDDMTAAALAYASHPHANVYAPLAVMRRDLARGKRGEKTDIVAVLGAVIDSDADAGRPATSPVPANYIVQSSAVPADNRQEFLLFNRALTRLEAEPLLDALQRASGADAGTKDADHVWRIPGTANWPNRKKVRDRNRPRNPQPVRVIKPWDGSLTNVDDLRATIAQCGEKQRSKEKARKANGQRTSKGSRSWFDYEELIKSGAPEGEDRSAAFHAVVCDLLPGNSST